MLKAGELAAQALELAGRNAVPGISTWELDRIVNDYVVSHGGSSPCKGYGGFPGHNCFSINEQLIHGIPSKKVILKEGDIISCDIVAELNGFMGDNTRTFRVGKVSEEADRLLKVTEEALYRGIEQAVAGNTGCYLGALDTLPLAEYQSISPLFSEDVYDALALSACVNGRKVFGGPAKESVLKQIEIIESFLDSLNK